MTSDRQRPLSPHLQIYRLPLNAITSITHRISGIVLALGVVLVVAYLIAAAAGSQTYGLAYDGAASWVGQIVLVGFTLALYYHLCAGVRHLVWDAGWGFSLRAARLGSWVIIAVSVVLTAATWLLAYSVGGQ